MAGKTKAPKAQKNTAKKTKTVEANSPPQDLSQAALKEAYEMMLLIRRFEERAGQLYGLGKIGGFCHLYSGQEAVVVGVDAA